MGSYQIVLPMPPSLNAMHGYARGGKVVYRSDKYKAWLEYAGISYRMQYPCGVQLLSGRLRAQYLYIFTDTRDSDVFNREKCLSDFLQNKFFVNDSQIDEGQVFKRKSSHGQSRVRVWITEIPDNRHLDTEFETDSEFLP